MANLRKAVAVAIALAAVTEQPSMAQISSPTPPVSAPAPAATPVESPCRAAVAANRSGTCLPALTRVILELRDAASSRTSTTGDRFKLALSSPVVVDGHVLIPAGTPGEGEIVHAKKTGVGVGGELVLAARFLELGNQKIRLRSMHLTGEGKDQQGLAFAVGAAVGLPALFIRGKHIDVPVGALAEAKIADDAWIDAPNPAQQ